MIVGGLEIVGVPVKLIRHITCCALMLSGCGMNGLKQPENAAEPGSVFSEANTVICEVMYAPHPHHKAAEVIGEDRLEQTLALDFDDMAAFSLEFMASTNDIAQDVAMSSGGMLEILDQSLVTGGYEGETIPSVVIRTSVHGDSGYADLIRMAARIGYVYVQDSTLVICPDEPVEDWEKLISVEVTDSGNETFFDSDSVRLFYGMMIGAFNGHEGLGYTFYEESGTFSTLAESSLESGGDSIIESIADRLYELSNGDVEFEVTRRSVWVFYPHNDWTTNPSGDSYVAFMDDGVVSDVTARRRVEFLSSVDVFLEKLVD